MECTHAITLIRIPRPERFVPREGEVLDKIGVAAAQDLDRRASEDCVAEPDVRLGDFDADGLYQRVLLQDRSAYPLGNRLGQVDGRTLYYFLNLLVYLAVVHGLRQVVGETRGAQVQAQLDVHDERLPQLALSGQRTVAAVKDHALEQYPVLGVFFAPGHPAQYKGP